MVEYLCLYHIFSTCHYLSYFMCSYFGVFFVLCSMALSWRYHCCQSHIPILGVVSFSWHVCLLLQLCLQSKKLLHSISPCLYVSISCMHSGGAFPERNMSILTSHLFFINQLIVKDYVIDFFSIRGSPDQTGCVMQTLEVCSSISLHVTGLFVSYEHRAVYFLKEWQGELSAGVNPFFSHFEGVIFSFSCTQ